MDEEKKYFCWRIFHVIDEFENELRMRVIDRLPADLLR